MTSPLLPGEYVEINVQDNKLTTGEDYTVAIFENDAYTKRRRQELNGDIEGDGVVTLDELQGGYATATFTANAEDGQQAKALFTAEDYDRINALNGWVDGVKYKAGSDKALVEGDTLTGTEYSLGGINRFEVTGEIVDSDRDGNRVKESQPTGHAQVWVQIQTSLGDKLNSYDSNWEISDGGEFFHLVSETSHRGDRVMIQRNGNELAVEGDQVFNVTVRNTTYDLEKTFAITVIDDVPTLIEETPTPPAAEVPTWTAPDTAPLRAFAGAQTQLDGIANIEFSDLSNWTQRWGTAGDDEIIGTRADEQLAGGQGNDLIKGRQGSDLLIGDNGEDDLRGNKGDDILYGGNDADKIRGGQGDDLLFGGEGADTFFINKGYDIIADFEVGADALRGLNKFGGMAVKDTADGTLLSHDFGSTLVVGVGAAELGLL